MKKLLLLSLFFATVAAPAHTQNWFSADHRWVFNLSGGFGGFDQDFEMVAEADTVIQGKTARKWVFHFSGFLQMEPKFTYSEGPRAYSYVANLDSFVKIYDFSLAVGDQVKIPKEWGSFTYKIEALDQVQAGSLTLKRQRVRYIQPDGTPSDWVFDILENAGMIGLALDVNFPTCAFVLIPEFQCGSVVDGFDIKFLCFSTPSGSFNPFNGSCSLVAANDPQNIDLQLKPNPTTDYFEIAGDSNGGTLQSVVLMNIAGKALRCWENAQLRYSLENLAAGVYVVDIRFDNGTRAVKRVVKLGVAP
jgi:Secretion system C-terminal sorting domain